MDPDEGMNAEVTYYMQDGNPTLPFDVEPDTGLLRITGQPITAERYTLFIEAKDNPLNMKEQRSSLAVVSIKVLVQNKHPPAFVGEPFQWGIDKQAKIGTVVGKLTGVDDDGDELTYDLLHGYVEGGK